VLNVTETEAKVLEATNDDGWCSSSSLMLEIAQATFSL
jgi:epsin